MTDPHAGSCGDAVQFVSQEPSGCSQEASQRPCIRVTLAVEHSVVNPNTPLARSHLTLVTTTDSTVAASTAPLLPRVANGDEFAVREVVARYGPLIWSLVRRWSPDTNDAEDAVQDVFVDLWRSAARFDATRSTEAGFVAMVTRRRLIDRLRKRQRAIEFEPLSENVDMAVDQEPDIDRGVRIERAREALRALPPAQRTMLELSLLHGRTHDEIARETNTPLGTVKSHIRRGLQRARDLLANDSSSNATSVRDVDGDPL